MIQCNTPTNDRDESVKEGFYRKLQSTIGNQRTDNITTLMDNLNAHTGSHIMSYEEIMGKTQTWG